MFPHCCSYLLDEDFFLSSCILFMSITSPQDEYLYLLQRYIEYEGTYVLYYHPCYFVPKSQ